MDELNIRIQKVKYHGCSCPFHPFQLLSYLICFFYIYSFFFIDIIILESFKIILILMYSIIVVLVIITALITTLTNPSDPTVALERKKRDNKYI